MEAITVGSDVNPAILDASPIESCYGLAEEGFDVNSEILDESHTKELETSPEKVVQNDIEAANSEEDDKNQANLETEESTPAAETPSPSKAEEKPEEIKGAPLSLSIDKIKEGAEALQAVPQQYNSKIYARIAALKDIPEEEYSAEKLDECIELSHEFSINSELLVISATAIVDSYLLLPENPRKFSQTMTCREKMQTNKNENFRSV